MSRQKQDQIHKTNKFTKIYSVSNKQRAIYLRTKILIWVRIYSKHCNETGLLHYGIISMQRVIEHVVC